MTQIECTIYITGKIVQPLSNNITALVEKEVKKSENLIKYLRKENYDTACNCVFNHNTNNFTVFTGYYYNRHDNKKCICDLKTNKKIEDKHCVMSNPNWKTSFGDYEYSLTHFKNDLVILDTCMFSIYF